MPDFKPKTPVNLAPPKDDPISLEELAKADGKKALIAG
jgi:membrane-associated progesterone receptor component